MSKQATKKLNNKGNTLVMVIVAMLIVAIIASLILSLVVKNLNNTRAKSSGTGNFYSAEHVLDELRIRLDQYADQAVRAAYSDWLASYIAEYGSGGGDAGLAESFKKVFASKFEELIISTPAVPGDPATVKNDIINNFFVDFSSTDVNITIGNVEVTDDGKAVVIHDIVVTYTDDSGYTTTISTDLVYDVTYPGFSSVSAVGVNDTVSSYAIVADGKITNSSVSLSDFADDKVKGQSNISAVIEGNVYGGGGTVKTTGGVSAFGYFTDGIEWGGSNSSLTLKSDTVLTRTNIGIYNHAKMSAAGRLSGFGADYPSNIWARNIWLGGESAFGGTSEVAVDILGNCYVKDDLTIDCKGGKFTLKGNYFGYSINNSSEGGVDPYTSKDLLAGTPDGSSSIIINKEDSTLDFLNADQLWIAGKSFVSIPGNYATKEDEAKLGSQLSFLLGESISYRGVQSAYLLPGECLNNVGHNPMTLAEYSTFIKNHPENIVLANSLLKGDGGIDLQRYVDSDKPYRTAFVNYSIDGTKETLVYLYLNFISSNKASEFFQSYEAVNSELIGKKMSVLGKGSIKLSANAINGVGSALVNTGNVVVYTPGVGDEIGTTDVINARYKTSDTVIRDKQIELSSKFTGLVTALKTNFPGDLESGRVTSSIVSFDDVADAFNEVEIDDIPGRAEKYYLVTGTNISIDDNKYINGAIVIAKGNVTLNCTDFKGLIIAGGKVLFNNANTKVTADPYYVSYLINRHPSVVDYFNGGIGSKPSGETILGSDLINATYDNWRKN